MREGVPRINRFMVFFKNYFFSEHIIDRFSKNVPSRTMKAIRNRENNFKHVSDVLFPKVDRRGPTANQSAGCGSLISVTVAFAIFFSEA